MPGGKGHYGAEHHDAEGGNLNATMGISFYASRIDLNVRRWKLETGIS